MASTVGDRLLRGEDISVHLSAQTAKGAINGTPEFFKVRRVSGKNSLVTSYTESGEVENSGQARQQIKERDDYNLEVASELSKQSIELMISAIYATEVVVTDTDTVYAATGTGFTSTGGELGALNLDVGDYFWVTGFVGTTINRLYRITAQGDANTWTTYPAPPATEAAGASVTITSRKSASGTTPTYYTSQTRTADDSKAGDIDYDTYYDGIIDNFTFEIPEAGPCTSNFTMFSERKVDGQAIISGQTDAAEDTDRSINAVSEVTDFFVQGVSQSCEVRTMSMEFSNSQQKDFAAGCSGARMARGAVTCSGSISIRSMYSSPFTWRDYNRNGTDVSIGTHLTHSDGSETVVIMRSCKVTEIDMPDGSNVIANTEATYAAQKDSTTATTVEVFRNWS